MSTTPDSILCSHAYSSDPGIPAALGPDSRRCSPYPNINDLMICRDAGVMMFQLFSVGCLPNEDFVAISNPFWFESSGVLPTR